MEQPGPIWGAVLGLGLRADLAWLNHPNPATAHCCSPANGERRRLTACTPRTLDEASVLRLYTPSANRNSKVLAFVFVVVEPRGLEPLTPCLQSRCSPG